MINRVQQLNISQLESSFNSLLEKHLVLNLPSQPNPNPIQSVIERGNLWSKKTRPVHKRLLVSVCKKNLILQIERGNLWNRAHTHTLKEFGSLEHRDTASSNANKFNLATDEENIDFNISGVPNSTVKRSHGVNIQNLFRRSRITLNENHCKVIFNNIEHLIPSAKNQKMRLKLLGTLNYAR